MFEIKGTIKVIQPTQEINEKFKKREFVLDVNSGQYPQVIPFEFTQDKCNLLDQYKIGQEVKVTFDLRGREWTNKQNETKYFLNLNAWRIEPAGASASSPEHSAPPPQYSAPHTAADAPAEDDDLPF